MLRTFQNPEKGLAFSQKKKKKRRKERKEEGFEKKSRAKNQSLNLVHIYIRVYGIITKNTLILIVKHANIKNKKK